MLHQALKDKIADGPYPKELTTYKTDNVQERVGEMAATHSTIVTVSSFIEYCSSKLLS